MAWRKQQILDFYDINTKSLFSSFLYKFYMCDKVISERANITLATDNIWKLKFLAKDFSPEIPGKRLFFFMNNNT